MNLEIKDFVIAQEPIVAKRMYIKLVELVFNERAKFEVLFFYGAEDYDMRLVKKDYVEISGDEYKGWKDDDNYIIDLIYEKLGACKKVYEKPEEEIIIDA